MKIRHKLVGGFLALSCLLGGIGFLNASLTSNAENKTKGIIRNEAEETKSHIELNNDLQNFRFQLARILLLKQENIAIESEKKEIKQVLSETIFLIDKQLEIHQKFLSNLGKRKTKTEQDEKKIENLIEEIPRIEKLKQSWLNNEVKLEKYFQLLDNNEMEAASQFLLTELEPELSEKIEAKLQADSNSALTRLNEKVLSVFNELRANKAIVDFSTLIGLVAVFIYGRYLYLSISEPLYQLRETALQVGQGDLNCQVKITNKDEIGDLAFCFEKMITGLKKKTVSKLYLDKILNSMNDSLIVIDLDGNIQTANQASFHLLGYSEIELMALKLTDILGESSLSLKELKQRKSLENCETKYLTKQGKEIHIIFSSSFIYNKYEEPCGIICVARDNTQRYEAQQALKKSQERYSLAVRANNEGLWDWNLITNEIYYSPAWKDLLGYDNSEIEATPEAWFSLVHPADLENLKKVIKSELTNFKVSYSLKDKDGNYRRMVCNGIKVKDETGKVNRITGSQTDMTRADFAEKRLQQLERIVIKLIDSSHTQNTKKSV